MPPGRRKRIARKDRSMTDTDRGKSVEAPLNPALKITTETAYDTDHTTPAPIDTASAKEGEGEGWPLIRSEEHTSELQSLMRISYAVFCLKKKKHNTKHNTAKTTPTRTQIIDRINTRTNKYNQI